MARDINSEEPSVSGSQLKPGPKGMVFLLVPRRQVFNEMYSLKCIHWRSICFLQESSQLKKALFLQFPIAAILHNIQAHSRPIFFSYSLVPQLSFIKMKQHCPLEHMGYYLMGKQVKLYKYMYVCSYRYRYRSRDRDNDMDNDILRAIAFNNSLSQMHSALSS